MTTQAIYLTLQLLPKSYFPNHLCNTIRLHNPPLIYYLDINLLLLLLYYVIMLLLYYYYYIILIYYLDYNYLKTGYFLTGYILNTDLKSTVIILFGAQSDLPEAP